MDKTSSNHPLCSVCARFLWFSALSVLFAALITGRAAAQPQELKREIFSPALGKGAIVVVASGAGGTASFSEFSSKLSELGYYTVLVDGNDVIRAATLRTVIADSQSAPQAIPGKVALVGFSLGGVAVLLHGAPLKDQVSVVVAYYPAIDWVVSDITSLAAKLQTPVLLFAGEADQNMGCCKIESMRALAAATKAVPFELVVYPNAGHAFNLHSLVSEYRAQDADDAWARTAAFLKRLHPCGGQ
jgi:dipeptidyl aminopeptidase/acylaminoacyl peptidase